MNVLNKKAVSQIKDDQQMQQKNVQLISVGDISFKGRFEDNPSDSLLNEMRPFFCSADMVIANLESPLVDQSMDSVPGKCTLRGSTKWATILKQMGVGLVSVANNHMMDFGEQGLFSTIKALDDAGIMHVGAGRNRHEACSPVVVEISQKKVAFFGRSSVEVSSRCYAGDQSPGVAYLQEDELLDTIKNVQENVDIIVVMLHWGIENYSYPSPSQRILAKKIIEAGANVLIGHHPHVLQGEEYIYNSVVSYSGGNFIFDEFFWPIIKEDGSKKYYKSIMNIQNRNSMMLKFDINENCVIKTIQIYTRINEDATVSIDLDKQRAIRYQILCKNLHLDRYDFLWKLYSIKREWDLRFKNEMTPWKILKKFYKIRPRHFREYALKLRRSIRISKGTSTNPYED